MSTALITKQLDDRADRSYCFNPNCRHPENSGDAVNCQGCSALLLLLNRYRAIRIISRSDRQKTFLARDDRGLSPSYYIIQQFLEPVNKAEKTAKLFAIEAELLQNKIQKLSKHKLIPKLLAYAIEDGYRYLISEYIESHSIERQLAVYGVFKEKELRLLLLDILPILKGLHRQGIVHQNLQPQHIIRRKSDRKIMLTNLGLNSVNNYSSYTAPEQIKGTAIYASDIYSLGILCIRLLTQADPQKVLNKRENVLNWRNYLDNKNSVGESLAKIIDRAIETNPERRYKSVDEILKDLKPIKNPLKLVPRKSSVRAAILLIIALLTTRYLFIPEKSLTNRPNLIGYTNYSNWIGEDKFNSKYPLESAILFGIIDGKKENLILENIKIETIISGNVAITEIKQSFSNPHDRPLRSVYKFLDPETMNIEGMEIKIGAKNYKSKITNKSEAIATFNRNIKETKTIALLQRDNNNVVTNVINNILPGETVEITLRYSNQVKFKNGEYQYNFPLAVLPKQKLDPSNQIETSVQIYGGMSVYDVKSSSHKIAVLHTTSGVKVELLPEKNLDKQDFILNYKLSSSQTGKKILTETNSIGSYFDLHLNPLKKYNNNQIVPKDIVFLIDSSRSQSEYSWPRSRVLMKNFIEQLNPEDTFTIIDFANNKNYFENRSFKNTPANRKNALNYLDNLQAGGRLQLNRGIDRLLQLPSTQDYFPSIVLIGNSSDSNSRKIIDRVKQNIKPEYRFYTFDPNNSRDRFKKDFFKKFDNTNQIEAYSEAQLSAKVEKFLAEINDPVLTKIKLDWIGSGKKPEIYPLEIPNLLTDRPVILYGYKSDRISGKLKLTGILSDGNKYEETIEINFIENQKDLVNFSDPFLQLIPQYWGLAKIRDLADFTSYKNRLKTITDTAIKYQILADDTAFISVSENVK